MAYNARQTEQKWQARWSEQKLYETDLNSSKPKFYNLVMFPYPSGDKLHVGHWYNYAPADSFGRYKRMNGFNVFEPMGYDSFGLPAENYAIKTGVAPQKSITDNTATMTRQLSEIGTMYDWGKSVTTSTPEYYKWTQWVFLDLYKKGLAYKKNAPVNWCPKDQTVLANEQVKEGLCERCGTEVTQKNLTQWFFNIKSYAEDFLNFEGLNWPEKTKLMQSHWIGRSEGSQIDFAVLDADGKTVSDKKITVFTTRIDTIFSGAYVVLAPEHPLVAELTTAEKMSEVEAYRDATKKTTDIERTAEDREKTGVFTGSYVINPANGERLQVWIADFVLAHYGTGAVFADAHDERDFKMAKKYKIPLKISILPARENFENASDYDELVAKINNFEVCFSDEGILVNSGQFDGLTSAVARKEITKSLEKKGSARFIINYKLRDWLISRQRYWGAPIPIVNCEKCGEQAVPENQLPVLLPEDVDFVPKGDGKSPIATSSNFVNTTCPKCSGPATREVDTMDTFMCSSWYFLRYLNPKNTEAAFDMELVKKWLPVDMYIGGPEHACMHLLYARFIHKVLMNDRKAEPFKTLVHQGLITKDGAKMSKSKGNVVSPDAFVEQYGSDVFRMYLMFMGPFTDGGDWNDRGITGISRFVERFYTLIMSEHRATDDENVARTLHATIKKVGEDIETFHFNTALAAMMTLINEAVPSGLTLASKKLFTQILAPLAPHLAEECWAHLGEKESIFDSTWPKFDPNMLVAGTFELVFSINGKVRGKVTVPMNISQADALVLAQNEPSLKPHLEGKTVVKEIFVPNKLLNIVVK